MFPLKIPQRLMSHANDNIFLLRIKVEDSERLHVGILIYDRWENSFRQYCKQKGIQPNVDVKTCIENHCKQHRYVDAGLQLSVTRTTSQQEAQKLSETCHHYYHLMSFLFVLLIQTWKFPGSYSRATNSSPLGETLQAILYEKASVISTLFVFLAFIL